MKTICLKSIASSVYTRVAEDCKTRRNIGLISKRDDDFWLWVKKEPSGSGTVLYFAKDRSALRPYESNPDSTSRGGSGCLGGRKFSSMKSLESYLSDFGQVVRCGGSKKRG